MYGIYGRYKYRYICIIGHIQCTTCTHIDIQNIHVNSKYPEIDAVGLVGNNLF